MKKLFFFCILAALFSLLFPGIQVQGKQLIDSLQNLLKTARQDTNKANILIQLSVAYWDNDPDTAMDYARQTLALSEQIGYKKGIGRAYSSMGIIIKSKGDYAQAIEMIKKSLKIREEIGDLQGTASSNNSLGLIYEGLGNYPEAFRFFYAALKINEKTGDARQKADNYNNIGILYFDQGNYPEALKNQLISLKIKEKIGNKRGIAQSYFNLGNIYQMQGNNTDALKYFLDAKKLREELGDKTGGIYSQIGLIYLAQGNYPEAIKCELQALKIHEKMGSKQGVRIDYNNLGNICYARGDYNEALKYYTASLKICEELENKAGMASSYNNIGGVYLKQKKFNEADQNMNKGLLLAKEVGGLDDIKNSYASLAQLDGARNNFNLALVHYKLSVAYRDSLINKGNTQKLVQSQMQYEFDKKEEVTRAEQDQKDIRQRNGRYSMMGGLAGLVIFLLVVFRQRNKISKEKKRSDELLVKSDNLLLNILPSEVAEEIKKEGHSKARTFSMVTVMFTDFKGFSSVSEKVSAELLVAEIDHCFSAFDNIIHKHRVEKIKTVGDAYICVGGMPALTLTHATDVLNAAIEIRDFMLERKKQQDAIEGISFELRLGIHTGPVVAGIVGVKKYAYDIWGDTVNIAARMEQNSEAGRINISGNTYELVKTKYNCVHRGKIEAKNKGMIDMYFVEP